MLRTCWVWQAAQPSDTYTSSPRRSLGVKGTMVGKGALLEASSLAGITATPMLRSTKTRSATLTRF